MNFGGFCVSCKKHFAYSASPPFIPITMSYCLSRTQCTCPPQVKNEFFTDLKRFGVHIFLKTDHVVLQSSKPRMEASRDESN